MALGFFPALKVRVNHRRHALRALILLVCWFGRNVWVEPPNYFRGLMGRKWFAIFFDEVDFSFIA